MTIYKVDIEMTLLVEGDEMPPDIREYNDYLKNIFSGQLTTYEGVRNRINEIYIRTEKIR